jgi:hypothetical protein
VPGTSFPQAKTADRKLSGASRHTAFMQITQIKDLGVITADLNASRDFYVAHLGFTPVFVSDWYIH